MNVVKKKLRNKIDDQFMSDCLICYVENEMFSPISNDVVFDLFKAMKNQKGTLWNVSDFTWFFRMMIFLFQIVKLTYYLLLFI